MNSSRPRRAEQRGLRLVLLLLALSVKLVTPSGFMPGSTPQAPFVICTGAGPVAVGRLDGRAAADPAHHGAATICAFADHAAWPAPHPPRIPAAAGAVAYQAPARPPAFDLVPGRGLVAPPPPSHAPPILL